MSRTFQVFCRLVAFALFMASCASTRAPNNAVPRRSAFEYDAFGGYMTLTRKDGTEASGELIGIRNDSVVLLTGACARIVRNEITKAIIITHNPNEYAWGYLSLLATISNGGFLIITGPLWIISTTAAVSNENRVWKEYPAKKKPQSRQESVSPEEAWKEVVKFSRFPAGIPSALDLTTLRGRPNRTSIR